jgi:hypothetical protein
MNIQLWTIYAVVILPFAALLSFAAPRLNTVAPIAPTDQQIDQVVMAVQGLSKHREAVLRGREILKGFLYRWGGGQ